MCCRYYLDESLDMEPFIKQMMRSPLFDMRPQTSPVKTSGEIRPADVVCVIAPNRSGKRSAFPMKWGYSGKSLIMNARVETAREKPTFKDDWASHRCIVPASCYFEWEHLQSPGGKTRTGDKYAIRPKGASATWLCGLYRMENDLPHFVILTRDASDCVSFIHDRMPLIMPDKFVSEWISPGADPDILVKNALTEMSAGRA